MKFGHKSFTNSGERRVINTKTAALAGACYASENGKTIVDDLGNKTFYEGPNKKQKYALGEVAGIDFEILKAKLENNKSKEKSFNEKPKSAVAVAAMSGNLNAKVETQLNQG